MCTARERLDVQRLRVVPVDAVADGAQQRQVAQALRRVGSAGHPAMLPRSAAMNQNLPSIRLRQPRRSVLSPEHG
jgi:hypothetical protein